MSNGTMNKLMVIGNVGNDPQFKQMEAFSVCNVNIATTEKVKGVKETEWHRCVFYGKLAEIVNEYVKKGDKIYVEGRLRTRKWKDNNGADHSVTEVLANEMQLLQGKDKASASEAAPVKEFDDIPF